MSEYLLPGVYLEEVPFSPHPIEGVGTSNAGFVGPTRFGPIDLVPACVTCLREYERVYGGGQELRFDAGRDARTNFLWHAARAFFENGGKRLQVARVFKANSDTDDGVAKWPPLGPPIAVRARFPGAAGNRRVRFTLKASPNFLGGTAAAPTVRGLVDHDVVLIRRGDPLTSGFFRAESEPDPTTLTLRWRFVDESLDPTEALLVGSCTSVQLVTLSVAIAPDGDDAAEEVWERVALDPRHRRGAVADALSELFHSTAATPAPARVPPIVVELPRGVDDGLEVLALFRAATADSGANLRASLADAVSTDASRSIEIMLEGGNDGRAPGPREYEGEAPHDGRPKTGLRAFEEIDELSIVAAPGSTSGYERDPQVAAAADSITRLLIDHCERLRYRVAVLDSGDGHSVANVRTMRARFDSTHAALYYPWVRVLDPLTQKEIVLPPSGFIAGIYARNDEQRGVFKAPANEVVKLAVGFETTLSAAQQELLNPEGINCLRSFEDRGLRVWGARTISSDPEWKYVNVRRYFAYLEHSIDRGTQWTVFEPNGEALWANVRRAIESFLLNEWKSGGLVGAKPEEAFFVRCDRSTMTQDDLDHGRLICRIGVATIEPAEFVIFRIGQWTADAHRC